MYSVFVMSTHTTTQLRAISLFEYRNVQSDVGVQAALTPQATD